ncbi:MAG: hypothetical protein OEV40_31425 [Acidimicrobiia bacterium]|nr:hypothetical protein [Acidimicrobiia bacterium]
MNEVIAALADFVSQPFGAVGAGCIMLAVTVINSRWLRGHLGMSDARIGHLFNGLNLVGGACLFLNAMIRNEIVWLVLETYFVLIALKGIMQAGRGRSQETGPDPETHTRPSDEAASELEYL